MQITLINQEQYNRLKEIQFNYPTLTYQNKGYDYPKTDEWSEDDNKAFKEVEDLLKEHIRGFSKLNHFRISKKGEIQLRFQYNYNWRGYGLPFIGVGYIDLKELLNGFN
ncbi:MAG: hypothetical protein KC589_02405 [Nanoarchaeota archaeon]|nr:hypothetical protein [Nanoarchaeota archaeon]